MPIIPPPSPSSARYVSPMGSTSRNVKHAIGEILKKISYKPGWKILLSEDQHYTGFFVTCTYEGYESESAAFDPICVENYRVSGARERLAISIGKSVRERKHFCFTRSFDEYSFQNMDMGAIVRYVIGETIKQAELYEFDRWFKYEGVPVFEQKGEER